MPFSKQSILLALVLLTPSCATLAKGGPRGQVSNPYHRALQLAGVPVLITVRGAPGTLTNVHLRILETMFMETYNTEQDCDALVENVSIENEGVYAGTGLASRIFALNGFVTVTETSLFPRLTVSTVMNRHNPMSSKSKSKSADLQKQCRLTKDTFVVAFDHAIEAGVRNDTFDFSIQNIVDVAELESADTVADCDSQNEFTSKVLVTFTGDPTIATQSQLDELAQSFLETYNSANNINPETCDPLFREVSSVSLVVAGQRKLGENEHVGMRALASQFTYLYEVISQCRGCGPNTRLFGEGSGRRQVADTVRSLQTSTCLCPVNATELRATTRDEFVEAYGISIVVLQEEGAVAEAFIESVVGVEETVVDEVFNETVVGAEENDCEADESFETQVFVKFTGSCSGEKEVLEQQFSSAYQQVAETFCDPYLRNITQVDIDQSLTGSGLCKFRFNVKGWCHGGCDENPTLFSAGESSCFCILDSTENRAPTMDEFEAGFNDTVANLNIVDIYMM